MSVNLAMVPPRLLLKRARDFWVANVRYWHLADINAASQNVAFRGESGHA
jgi:hypothetical protein